MSQYVSHVVRISGHAIRINGPRDRAVNLSRFFPHLSSLKKNACFYSKRRDSDPKHTSTRPWRYRYAFPSCRTAIAASFHSCQTGGTLMADGPHRDDAVRPSPPHKQKQLRKRAKLLNNDGLEWRRWWWPHCWFLLIQHNSAKFSIIQNWDCVESYQVFYRCWKMLKIVDRCWKMLKGGNLHWIWYVKLKSSLNLIREVKWSSSKSPTS